ncbi:MAG: hypothetical protein K6T92_08035, partial [Candidatus Rokubacteria bacterium]|nr:hypothetical protein [Candidatus Rokubacteria bacterium]
WLSGAEDELADARARFDAGDPDGAAAHARQATDLAAGAAERGRERAALAAALLVGVALAASITGRLRRRGAPPAAAG